MTATSKIPKRLLTHRDKAGQLGVSTRTVDRWCESGILRPPTIINKRKYHDADDKPRADGGKAGVISALT